MKPYPIKEFARAVCGYDSRNPVLAMIVAYFDESGTQDRSVVVNVGGLIGDMREWNRLEKPWQKNLAVTGVEWFHAWECEEGEEQFARIPCGLRTALRNGLTNAICARKLAYVGGAVYRKDWNDAATPAFKSEFASPFAFAVTTAVRQTSDLALKSFPGERVAFVFALPNAAEKEHVVRIHSTYQDHPNWPNIGSLSFDTPRALIQLQAADLMAFEIYRNLRERREKPEIEFRIRRPMLQFHQTNYPMRIGYFDREGIVGIIKDYEKLGAASA